MNKKYFLQNTLTGALLDATNLILACWKKNGELVYCSKSFMEFFGISSIDEFIENKAFMPNTQGNGRNSIELGKEYLNQAVSEGFCSFDWLHLLNDKIIKIKYELTLINDCDEEIILSKFNENYEDLLINEDEIEADIRARITLDAAPVAITFWNRNFDAIDCNAAAISMLGFSSKQEYLDGIYNSYPEKQPNGQNSIRFAKDVLAKALNTGSCTVEWTYIDTNGEPVPTEVHLVRISYQSQLMIIEYSRDLREINASKLKAIQAEQRTLAMLESMPIGVNLWNSAYETVDCNFAAMNMLGFETKKEYLEKFYDCSPECQPNGGYSLNLMMLYLQEAFETGYKRFEWVLKTIFGEPLQIEVTLIRVSINDEFMIAAYQRDFSELVATRVRAREAEQRAMIMLDTMPLCANFWNQEFHNIDCNLAAVKLFELNSKKDYIERFFELSPEFQPNGIASSELALKNISTAFEQGFCTFEWLHQKPNGEPIPAEITLIRTDYHGEPIVVGYTKDLRELKKSQELIKAAESRTQVMFDATPLSIKFWDDNQNLLDCNEESIRLFGFSSKQELLDNFWQTIPTEQPDGKPSSVLVLEKLSTALKEGFCRFDAMYQNPSTGLAIPAEVTLVRIKNDDKHAIVSYLRDLRELETMLSEIHEVENDLRLARDLAEKSTQAKSEFLANMSHEIRTPMNGILGLLYLLAQTSLNDAQEGYIQNILFSANNLLRIINDILDFSKIEAGKLELESIPFALDEICCELKTLFAPKAAEKSIALKINCGDLSDTLIMSDPVRIKQILFNLVGNALKFTQQGSIELNVSSQINNGILSCEFAVKDTGIGLSEEQIKRIFSAFSQADSSVTRKFGGTGLGLVIAKSIAQMLNGDIKIVSQLHTGSTFYFTCDFNVASDEDISCYKKSLDPSPLGQGKYHGHLLLVEDNEINQIVACELLKNVGYTVDIAGNGEEALDMLANNRYDLVLMDIQMPIMDGLTATKKIRQNTDLDNLPILAMSAHAMSGDKEISIQHGMNDHITKPINPQQLYRKLSYWLKN